MTVASDLLNSVNGIGYSAGDDPWGVAAASLAKSAPLVVNPYGSVGSNIAGSVGVGLLSALMAGLASNSADDKNKELQPLIRSYINGTPDQQDALVQQNPRLAKLQGIAMEIQADKDAKKQELENQIQLKQTPNGAQLTPLGDTIVNALNAKGITGIQTAEDLKQLGDLQKVTKENKISQSQVSSLNDKLKALGQLNEVSDLVDNMGGDNMASALWRNMSQSWDPNSGLSTYRRALPALADELAKGYAGTARAYTTKTLQDSLDAVPGETQDKIKEALNFHKGNLLADALGQIDKLKGTGYDIGDLSSQLEAARTGQLKIDPLATIAAAATQDSTPQQQGDPAAIAELKRRGLL